MTTGGGAPNHTATDDRDVGIRGVHRLPGNDTQLFGHYFGLKESPESLFGRRIDLVTVGSLSNPYLIEAVNKTRQLIDVAENTGAGSRHGATRILPLAYLLASHAMRRYSYQIRERNRATMESTTLGLKLDVNTRKRLSAIARKKDRPARWVIKKAIQEYLDREEQAEEQRAEDDARWEKYVATGEAIPHRRVMAWLDELAAGQDISWRR